MSQSHICVMEFTSQDMQSIKAGVESNPITRAMASINHTEVVEKITRKVKAMAITKNCRKNTNIHQHYFIIQGLIILRPPRSESGGRQAYLPTGRLRTDFL